MRIGIATPVIQRGRTGVAQYVFGLTRALLRTGTSHRFTLFVMEEDLPLFAFAKDDMELVSIPECFRPPLQNIRWHQFHLPRLAAAHGLDVLHVPSYRRMLWKRPCTLVATIHDLAPFHVGAKYDRMRMFYGRVVARALAGRQHRIITVSETTAKDLRHFFKLSADRLAVIHNGIDHGRFQPSSDGSEKSWTASRHGLNQPFFLYVARLEHPGKNHVRLIEAFGRFKSRTGSSWQLALAGADWHGADVIHAARRASPYASDIRCLGFLADDEVPRLYRAAGAMVFPSLFEGFGLPVVEAMACGCPVICSPRGALGEIAGDAAATADPEDTDAWSDRMAELAGDASGRDRLRAAGLLRAQRFNWDANARATLEVYAEARARAAEHSRAKTRRCEEDTGSELSDVPPTS